MDIFWQITIVEFMLNLAVFATAVIAYRPTWTAAARLWPESQLARRAAVGILFGAATLAPIGAYVSVDARAAYRLTDWATLAVSGQNLLQSPQRQTAGADVERQVLATLSVRY